MRILLPTLPYLALLLVTLGPVEASDTKGKPNIVLMYSDNVGYGDYACYGNKMVRTPRIDQLARDGVRCTDFYVVAATCTASRGALLTGRYPQRNGLMHQLVTTENWDGIGLPHRERILPEYLREAGYATGCFGKWNIGFAKGSRPTERGFDEFFGCRSGNIHYFKHTYHGEYDLFRGTERHRVEGYSTDLFADAACDFIRRHAQTPFFLYLPFNAPHYVSDINTMPDTTEKPEWQVPGKYLEQYGWPANDANELHRYLAVLTAMDDATGRVLDTLDSLGLREQTLVMHISDMGAILRPGRGLGVASNAPFRDGAPSLYEGGIRVPAIFRWPGRIPAGTVTDALLTHLDILPLCLAVTGAAPMPGRILDGRDPLPALRGTGPSPHERMMASLRDFSALREGKLKILRKKPDAAWELYDLAADPGETHDLAQDRPADVARLDAEFRKWQADVLRDASPPAPWNAPRKPRAGTTSRSTGG
ncbi:MAG: sulfatase-like hydrolase/transferase [Pirellulaceae bacterium]